MDQDAFRNILASGSGSGSTKSKSRGVLGGHAPKRGGWGIKAKPGHEYKPPADELKPSTTFAPRNTKKKDPTAGKYVDRAELRRQGKDDEYRPVEQLLEDLEKRQKQEGFDKEEIDKQRAYLGGDATHSILVKGLDHALLAKTRAELAAKGEEVADEELEAIALGAKAQKKTTEPPNAEEKAAKGFKSISAKDDKKESSGVNGEKKKKKKKKVKQEEVHAGLKETVKKPIEAEKPVESTLEAGPSRVMKKEPTPPPVDDDDDIFGDAGDYDLKAGREDEDDSSDEEGEEQEDVDGKEDITVKRSRSRSRSLDRDYRRRTDSGERYDGRRDVDARYNRRDRSYSRERHDRRERSYSRERYDDRRRYSSRADGYDDYDRRSRYQRSPSRERYSDRRRDGSYSRDRFDDRRDRGYQRSPSPRRASHKEYSPPRKHSRSPSPPAKRPRQKTRSPSPITFDFTGRPPSPTPSAESDDDHLVGGKLQPLKSSAISDVKGYLSLDAEAAKEDEKRARKAKWRARQGLGVQEGAEKFLEREVGDKEKMNRDYVNVMNKIKKDEKE